MRFRSSRYISNCNYTPGRTLSVKQTDTTCSVKWSGELREEFALHLQLAEIHRPRMWIERNGDSEAAMLTFYPDIACAEGVKRIAIAVDCSRSMKASWKEVIMLARLILSQLPMDCLFNVYMVGATFIELFPSYTIPTKERLEEADDFILSLRPTAPSVNFYKMLSTYLVLKPAMIAHQFINNMVFVSDGLVANPALTLDAVRQFNYSERVLAACISPHGNKHFMQSLAQLSGGAYRLFAGKGKWISGVHELLKICMEPGLTHVDIKWKAFGLNKDKIEQAPIYISSLFNRTRQIVYGFVPNCRAATLLASVGDQELETLVSCEDLHVTRGDTLHKLAARALIEDYFNGNLRMVRSE